MEPFFHDEYSDAELRGILRFLKNKVRKRFAIYGFTTDCVKEVRTLVDEDSWVPGFEEWAVNTIKEEREAHERQERETKDMQEEMIRLKAENNLLKQQMRDVYCVHGNVNNDDPLLKWLIKPWVYHLEQSLNQCHNHPETARVFSELINSGSTSRAVVLSEKFLQACIPHLTNYSYPVTAKSLKEGVRKIINLS